MNQRIKHIVQETFKSLPMDNTKPEEWIDKFVLEVSRKLIFECSDVVRKSANNYGDEMKIILKATAVDVLDHFGL